MWCILPFLMAHPYGSQLKITSELKQVPHPSISRLYLLFFHL
jgi:hypothetical protein